MKTGMKRLTAGQEGEVSVAYREAVAKVMGEPEDKTKDGFIAVITLSPSSLGG